MPVALEHRKEWYREWHKLHPGRRAEYSRKFHESHPGAHHFAQLKYAYGLEDAEQLYANLFLQQKGRCALCSSREPGGKFQFFCLDHDHRTGRVRGLLCADCNVALGRFKDNFKVLEKAIQYLKG
jgi:hypothetical protein